MYNAIKTNKDKELTTSSCGRQEAKEEERSRTRVGTEHLER